MVCLSVGARRFPIDIKYVDDLCTGTSELPPSLMNQARDLMNATRHCSPEVVPTNVPKQQYNFVFNLIRTISRVGTGILVFVSGIADITDLTEKFEGLDKYKVIPIHSEIPFEEQETAFLPAEPNEVKVIIAGKFCFLHKDCLMMTCDS
jgi:HrpA-like RNA helicase